MKQKPSFQFYPQDFLGSLDVQTMTIEEVGCYCLLMFNMYNNGGSLPNDENVLKALCRGYSPTPKVLKKFEVDGEFLKQKRIDFEIKKIKKFKKEMREAGVKGAKVRWDKRKNSDRVGHSQAIARPWGNDSSSTSTSTSTSSSFKKENIDNKEKISKQVSHSAEAEEIILFFEEKFGTKVLARTPKRLKLLKERISSLGLEAIKSAIEGFAGSPWHRGSNDTGWKANLDFIIKSDEQIEKGVNLLKPVSSPTRDLKKLSNKELQEEYERQQLTR